MHDAFETLDPSMAVHNLHGARSAHDTSFFADCKYDSYRGFTPECMRLRNLFVAKEFGKPIRCSPDDNVLVRAGLARQEWIHESRTDTWWKCCETRGSLGGVGAANWVDDFAEIDMGSAPGFWGRAGMLNEFSYPSRSKPLNIQMPAELAQGKAMAHLGGTDIPNPDYKDHAPHYLPPSGPQMVCEPYENLKHKQATDGDFKVEDVLNFKGPVGGPLTAGLGGLWCSGPHAVGLTRMKPGTVQAFRLTDEGFCIYTGPPGVADVSGRKYKVFELSVPLLVTLLLPPRCQSAHADFL